MKSVTTYWRLETGDTRSDWFRSILDTGSYLPVHSYPSTTSYICPYPTIALQSYSMSWVTTATGLTEYLFCVKSGNLQRFRRIWNLVSGPFMLDFWLKQKTSLFAIFSNFLFPDWKRMRIKANDAILIAFLAALSEWKQIATKKSWNKDDQYEHPAARESYPL